MFNLIKWGFSGLIDFLFTEKGGAVLVAAGIFLLILASAVG